MTDKSNQTDIVASLASEDDLFSQANAHWLYGEWEKLTEYKAEEVVEQHQKAKIASLIASAYLQLEQTQQAHYWLRLATTWGVDKTALSKILIAGINNTLGRISSLKKDDENAASYYKKAVNVTKNSELVAYSRAIKELASLGLLPQASKLVSKQFDIVKNKSSQVKDVAAHLKVLETSLELLNHELSISQQRSQLYHTQQDNQPSAKVGSDEYLEKLKRRSVSQLGQDIWVLEKTNFKKGGFFVEFGATDGVLLSNTYLLEKEFEWKGICAEPNPKFFVKLKKNRNCKVSNACIAGKSNEEVEFIFADEYGGMDKYASADSHADKRDAFRNAAGSTKLVTISLDSFLEKNQAPKTIDYISIDTEGSELEILETFPFHKWNVKIFSIEHNFTVSRGLIFKLLSNNGYKRYELEWDDIYYR